MTKSPINLSIENKILEKAKKHIPNISEFTEECLKQYLGISEGNCPTADIQEIVNEIGQLQTKIYILNQNTNLEENMRKIEQEKIDRPWRGLYHDYRGRRNINPYLLEEALKVLPVDSETLEDILDYAVCNQDRLPLNCTWEEAHKLYQKEVMEEL